MEKIESLRVVTRNANIHEMPVPLILALAGRRIDPENADYKRFPLSAVPAVKEQLKHFFKEHHVKHLVSSAACGADLLAQDVAAELNIERTVVIPFDLEVFRKTSVDDRAGDWGILYDKLVTDSSQSVTLLKYDEHDPRAYEKTNFELLETAQRLSLQHKNVEVAVLIVWEGKPKDKDDLTLALQVEAKRRSLKTNEIKTIA